jgi:hypothetical protein
MNLNILKRLKNKREVICDVPLEKIKEEIEDCKKLLKNIPVHNLFRYILEYPFIL